MPSMSDRQPDNAYQFCYYPAKEAAESSEVVNAVSHVFSNSFGNTPEGKPYRLGPRTTKARIESTRHVIVSRHHAVPVGYIYARVIASTDAVVGWIDSLAVMPDHRRRKIATRLIGDLLEKISDCRWVGCATPNPVAALVITRVVRGDAYVGECNPPREVIDMIQTIRSRCPDLRGADIHPQRLLVRTNFSPVSSEETTDWSPPHPSEPPPWWAFLKSLPSHYEALLVIDRKDFLLEYGV